MAASLRIGMGFNGIREFGYEFKETLSPFGSNNAVAWRNEFKVKPIVLGSHTSASYHMENCAYNIQASTWSEMNNNSNNNMREIQSAQDLVDSLMNAGDKLVIVHYYSPSCGGCKPLLPKMDQFAKENGNAIFLKVNQEVHKSMCYALNVRVMPFFQFYRGSKGRVCSFSCTIATIKKFKDALEKHGGDKDHYNIGPPKGLGDSELFMLALNKLIDINKYPKLRDFDSGDSGIFGNGFCAA